MTLPDPLTAPDRNARLDDASPRAVESCGYAWCTTAHGATTHPEDEDHRSAGILVAATVRDGAPPRGVELEVGLLRRRHDDEPWLVIEDGAGVHLEITLESARRATSALGDDTGLRAAFGLAD